MRPIVMRRSDGKRWIHFLVIRDSEVTLLECVPALFGGWTHYRTSRQGIDEWGGMNASDIVAFKRSSGDDLIANASDSDTETVLRLEQERGVPWWREGR